MKFFVDLIITTILYMVGFYLTREFDMTSNNVFLIGYLTGTLASVIMTTVSISFKKYDSN